MIQTLLLDLWIQCYRLEAVSTRCCSSPEFELALYTLCFVGGTEQNTVQMGGWDMLIK